MIDHTTPADSTELVTPERNGTTVDPLGIPEEILDDWRWIYEQRANSGFEEYRGKHIVVLDKRVLGASTDPDLLVQYLVLKDKVDPRRLVITYIDRY